MDEEEKVAVGSGDTDFEEVSVGEKVAPVSVTGKENVGGGVSDSEMVSSERESD